MIWGPLWLETQVAAAGVFVGLFAQGLHGGGEVLGSRQLRGGGDVRGRLHRNGQGQADRAAHAGEGSCTPCGMWQGWT